MSKKHRIVQSGNDSVWKKHCGFLDLSVKEFLAVQDKMLLEQLQKIGQSSLEQRIIGGKPLASVADFRDSVRLTRYPDYLPELGINNADALPEEPYVWVHTSGQGTSFMNIPYTRRFYERLLEDLMAIFILSCSSGRGQSTLAEGDRVLFNAAPSPYLGGVMAAGATERFPLSPLYSPDAHDEMDFKQKVARGFEIALKTGVDITVAMTSVLVKMGRDFGKQSRRGGMMNYLRQPAVLLRLLRALVRSRLEHRGILPKDLWPMKTLIGWGIDTSVYREQVYQYWGKYPYEFHACTEAGFIGVQSWTKKDLTLVPYTNFLEFIPEMEVQESRKDPSYQPRTVRLDELEPGKRYELVITNFHGMPFIRYRLGHLIRVKSLRDDEAGIGLPQVAFEGRIDSLIDIAGFTRLSEKTIAQAIANVHMHAEGWSIRKEIIEGNPVLSLYAEIIDGGDPEKMTRDLHTELKRADLFYDDLDSMMDIQPLRIIPLHPGTFSDYYDEKQKEGAELHELKPPSINAADDIIRDLQRISDELGRAG